MSEKNGGTGRVVQFWHLGQKEKMISDLRFEISAPKRADTRLRGHKLETRPYGKQRGQTIGLPPY
jgi:hypothetical protein